MEKLKPDILALIREAMGSNLDKSKEDFPYHPNPRYRPVRFSADNFSFPEKSHGRTMRSFTDGGSADIIVAPNFCVGMVRTACVGFLDRQRVSNTRREYYYLTSLVSPEKIKAELFPVSGKEEQIAPLGFDTKELFDDEVDLSQVTHTIRKILELRLAVEAMDTLPAGSIMTLDGTLECRNRAEEPFWKALKQKALKRGILLTALAKTCRLITKNGDSLIGRVSSTAPKGEWFYHPVFKIESEQHQADMYIVKLHRNSDYAFRFEIFSEQLNTVDPGKVIGMLTQHSADPAFVGYPYGLVAVDQVARISNSEKSYLTTKLMASAGGDWKRFKPYTSALNAHEKLDKK